MKMKLTLLMTAIILLGFSSFKESPRDFDYIISDIARNFRLEIMDEDECENLKRAADDLSDKIEDEIKKSDEYTSAEIIELKNLKKEAEALEEFIATVGSCGNYIPSLDNFNLANRRVGASVNNIIKDKYCVDIISVSIGDYIAYLGKNNSSKNYTVAYKWKAANGMNYGNGTMGLSKMSVRHIYNNRENPSQKNITVYEITCKEF